MEFLPPRRGSRRQAGGVSTTGTALRAGLLLAALLALSRPSAGETRAPAAADPFTVAAQAYLLDINGQPRWQRNADLPLAPASLTKLMTALLVLEEGDLEGVLPVSAAAARQTGTRIGLRAGERYRKKDLLAAALVSSANDACQALAESGGAPSSTDAFVQKMNRRAAALGLTATRFRNPCGFDAPGHLSTARELAVIARAALRFPEFARIVAQQRVAIRAEGGQRILTKKSTNPLIGNYAPVVGVKTGYTTHAGACLVALGRRGDTEVLLVLLNARKRWWDAVGMLEHGFVTARDEGARP